ncbi:MAG: NADH-quinone oxidoreductase subunit L [Bryobacteraceae bacterium]|nr:NADH-quinone oxidoreductase subunit L [Bryobacterales bacterium]MEB2362917.1 NADH-quinone oxidoreductase subunit L [Bryobacterales bacterium]NUN00853.1 NADH-quinone oxidoreductase subunit L [Bryobacteraceae bacterium]
MLSLLWLVPAIPLATAAILALFGARLTRRAVAAMGAGSIGVSCVISLLIAPALLTSETPYRQTLWTWIDVAQFQPRIGFYLDAMSLLMMLVVTLVSFLIHLYSTEFMEEDEGYSRFFAYMNLFVASMVVLVLADNLLLLYLGWEGVGLCSYLLIGFWYRDPANGLAARKAFIVTRVGDTAMAVGLFMLFHSLGTLEIQRLMEQAQAQWAGGSPYATAAALLLLGGAVGKSAQLPLQTWLPDAMAGPTPTSALIHAATMVTAGVYLIARTNVLYTLAPDAQLAVAVVGAVTLLVAGFSALTQSDIKRVLAYSTVSQIGYMFLALGVGAWSAALFHFMTHAFFKALLFLAAGIVIEALHHEHNIFRMGGLRRELPVAFWTFVAGGCALAGLPLITSGYFSKDLIIWEAWSSPLGGPLLWAAGMAGVLLTALYTFRLIFLVFSGARKTEVSHRSGFRMKATVIVLAALAVVSGYWKSPLLDFLHTALPSMEEAHAGMTETMSGVVAAALFAAGLFAAYLFFLAKPQYSGAAARNPVFGTLHRYWFSGWGFDWLYNRVFVRPLLGAARINRNDFVDAICAGIARFTEGANHLLAATQTGRVRWYAAGIAAGAVIFVGVAILL